MKFRNRNEWSWKTFLDDVVLPNRRQNRGKISILMCFFWIAMIHRKTFSILTSFFKSSKSDCYKVCILTWFFLIATIDRDKICILTWHFSTSKKKVLKTIPAWHDISKSQWRIVKKFFLDVVFLNHNGWTWNYFHVDVTFLNRNE